MNFHINFYFLFKSRFGNAQPTSAEQFWSRGRLGLQTKSAKHFHGPNDRTQDTSKCSQRQSAIQTETFECVLTTLVAMATQNLAESTPDLG